MAKAATKSNDPTANIGFEAKLWLAADKLRNNMDPAEYKHVVLGLIFIKYISDAFEEMRAKLITGKGEYEGSDPEDADEYRAENVFWVPKEARWSHLMASAKLPTIGKVIDDAMVALERDNQGLKGVLPKNYARPALDKHHLVPDDYAGFVLANGSMSSNQSGEGDIRKVIIEADLVDCMVALPGQLFYSTQIPVCLLFLTKNKNDGKRRDQRRQTLFIDARKLGMLVDRVHRELTDAEGEGYQDIPGFCKSTDLDLIKQHGYVLTPGRYVVAEEIEDDGEPFEEKMQRLVAQLDTQFTESAKLEKQIKHNLASLGHALEQIS